MDDWIPRLKEGVDVRGLPLTPEEGFLLSRLDGTTSLAALPTLTGLAVGRVQAILARLQQLGALVPAPASRRPQAAALPGQAQADEDEGAEAPASAEASAQEEAQALTLRALFERRLRMLEPEARLALASGAGEPELSALCFDPLPRVVQALLANPRATAVHARLVARHHRTPQGLEALAARGPLLRDAEVDRWLLRNPQLSAGLARRLLAPRRLLLLFRLTVDREVPEGTRRTAREALRARFGTTSAEERVELILRTEGRVLPQLVGLGVDGRTAALLCAQPYRSTLLIQNLARWGPCPPALLAHLLRQELVRRQPTLRTLLLRHPNVPGELRRA